MLQYNGYGYVTHLLRKNPIVKFVGCLAIEITVVTMNYPKFSYSETEAKSLENPDEVGGPQTQVCSKDPQDLCSAAGVYPTISDPGLEYELAPYFGGFLDLRRDTKEYKNKVSKTGARTCLASDLYNQIPKLY